MLFESRLHLRLAAFQRPCYPPPSLRELRPGCRHGGRVQLVLLVPVGRVCLKPAYHLGQRFPEAVARLPAEQFASARNINLVVVVGVLDHPRLDVGVLVQHLGLEPRSSFGQTLRQRQRSPFLVVNEPSDPLLHLLVGKRLLLADQQHRLVGKLRAAVDGSDHCVDEIVPVQIGLAAFEIAREEIGRRPPFEDARDLLCDEGRAAVLVIDAGEPENDGLYVAALAADQSFGFHLRFWVGPRRIERRILVDPHSLFRTRSVDEQGAGEDELLGFQRLEGGKQPTRSLHRDGVIFRIVLPVVS